MNKPVPVPDARELTRAFDHAADSYDAAAYSQREIAQRMLSRFELLRIAPKRILDIGCATGDATRKLAARFPEADMLAIDLSGRMLAKMRNAAPWWKKHLPFLGEHAPRCVQADPAALPFKAGICDLIWSNLALYWRDLEASVREAHRCLAVDGLFMFSSLGPDTLKEWRGAFATVDNCVHVSRFIDMHDVGDALVRAGFTDPVMDMEMLTVNFDSVDAIVRDLAALGARNRFPGRRAGLLGRAAWQRVVAAYERLRVDGKLPVTLEVVYGHAWKPAPKATADGRAIVQFQPYKHFNPKL